MFFKIVHGECTVKIGRCAMIAQKLCRCGVVLTNEKLSVAFSMCPAHSGQEKISEISVF
tara:strand:+ start:807 stop:983 length:177 start_codon:yes stop_codon:yes gene_type:complete